MFQNFDDPGSTSNVPERLQALRARMQEQKLDAYLVPHGDEFQNEYLPPSAERLAFLTGFTGSAGFSIVTAEQALLFVDGRYTLQAARQTGKAKITVKDLLDEPPSDWLAGNASTDGRVGYDPWLLTVKQKESFESALAKSGAALIATENLVDAVWYDRPAAPKGRISVHPLEFAGQAASEKLEKMVEEMRQAGAQFCLITDPASLAWLFNIRGSDVVHTPIALGFALLCQNRKPILYISPEKLGAEAEEYLADLCEIRPPELLEKSLAENVAGATVMCDPDRVASRLAEIVADAGGTVVRHRDPAVLAKAMKNDAEIAGARAAQLRDGVAMVRFLAWLDRCEPGSVDEIGTARMLEQFRHETAKRMNSELREIAFDTISGAGANGAIVHYRVTEATNATLAAGSLYLVDSGGQYPDGTTDITRTIAIGNPPEGAKKDFTLVLKGHIAIATARFPSGTRGVDIDALARIALWRAGRDYAHGTGHGVGSYLSVHEGPQGISRRATEPLRPGMIISNEPGYYVEGRYGIRIENLVLVTPAAPRDGGNTEVHEFETLTLAPIDLRLIDAEALVPQEIQWLNAYHARVLAELSPWLDETDTAWLTEATRPLAG
jgi:Xaa-Pro aminopeptidase